MVGVTGSIPVALTSVCNDWRIEMSATEFRSRHALFTLKNLRQPRRLRLEQGAEIGNCMLQALGQRYARLPSQTHSGQGNVWAALARVVLRKGQIEDLRSRSRLLDDKLGESLDGELGRIPQIDRTGEIGGRVHQTDEALNQVIDIAEGPVAPM